MEKTYDIKMGLWDVLASFRMEFGKEPSYITISDYIYYNIKFEKFRKDYIHAFNNEAFCGIPLVILKGFNNLPDNHVGLHMIPAGYKLVRDIHDEKGGEYYTVKGTLSEGYIDSGRFEITLGTIKGISIDDQVETLFKAYIKNGIKITSAERYD